MTISSWLYEKFPWDFTDKIGLTKNPLIPDVKTSGTPVAGIAQSGNGKIIIALLATAAGVYFIMRKK